MMIEKYNVPAPARAEPEPPHRERDCTHNFELRTKTLVTGAIVYQRQCTVCGQAGQFLKHDSLPPADRDAARAMDPELSTRYWMASQERKRLEREAKQAAQHTDWFKWYDDYLRSAIWAKRRAQVLKRENGFCECCGCNRAENVHHMTYEHVGEERLWELVAVCPECHDYLHNGVTAW